MISLTSEQVTVTYAMLRQTGMLRGQEIGIPVSVSSPAKGLKWKRFHEVDQEDFKAIESYFLLFHF